MSFYQLPHPWDPGYAIPKYVMGEPPERGVFVTQWMPRGTIPTLVPDYLAKPGEKILGRADADLGSLSGSCLGGSTLGGSTLAGHTLRGHSLGATEYQLVPTGLGGTGGRADYNAFGQKAANRMIAAVKALPPDRRSGALTAAMQKIDPSLPARCQKYTNEAAARGAAPAAALKQGLGRALTEGLAKVGNSRSAPQSDSLRGLGCIRAQGALGADPTYIPSASGSGKGIPASDGGTLVMPPVTPQGEKGITANEQTFTPMIQVGPFMMLDQVGSKINLRGESLAAVSALVSKAILKASATWLAMHASEITQNLSLLDKTALGRMFGPGSSGSVPREIVNGTRPIFMFKHPGTGEVMGLAIGDLSTSVTPGFSLTYVHVDRSWLSRAVDSLTELVAKIINVACSFVNKPGAAAAAASVYPVAGAGVVVAQQTICGQPVPTLPPPVARSGYLLPLAIGGGVLLVVAAVAIRRRRR